MGLLDKLKKSGQSATKREESNHISEAALDEMSYIEDTHHIEGPWHQYDYLLAAGGYGWEYMLSSADYMTRADLQNIGTVSVGYIPNGDATELIDEYRAVGESIVAMKTLEEEGANLGIGGISKVVGMPVKVVWFNQTRMLRIFSPVNDEELFLRYAETVIRRTFDTEYAMKKYRPVPKPN